MDVQYEIGKPEDLETFLELMREYYAYDGHEYDDAKARRALSKLLTVDQWGCAWLIRAGEAIIGYMVMCFGYSLEFGGRDAFLDEIYLREAYRGKGIGGQAIQYMVEDCRARGIKALHLEVMPGNARAIGFYERAGFENRGSSLMSQYME
jgi:ribosomal protein S18 acetylase RimI-like enzyme